MASRSGSRPRPRLRARSRPRQQLAATMDLGTDHGFRRVHCAPGRFGAAGMRHVGRLPETGCDDECDIRPHPGERSPRSLRSRHPALLRPRSRWKSIRTTNAPTARDSTKKPFRWILTQYVATEKARLSSPRSSIAAACLGEARGAVFQRSRRTRDSTTSWSSRIFQTARAPGGRTAISRPSLTQVLVRPA